ncbi:hypothetical protein [Neobacillus soli]|uniref:hypothetical protein n=1 Tax=Neobacillus soli TaxID=220688 RepID=UPI00082688EB|nr:hypothetical protein [Neobacillus soli]
MLTAAQQKVKQELEELQIRAQVHSNDEAVSTNNSRSLKKWAYAIGGLFALILICSFFLSDYAASTPEKIVSYLAIEQNCNVQSEQLLYDLIEKNAITPQHAKAMQAELLKKVHALKAPSSFNGHKQDLIDVFEQQLEIITYLSNIKTLNSTQLNKKIIELNIKKELAAESLMNAFANKHIKYLRQEDGTVHYWVESKMYQY